MNSSTSSISTTTSRTKISPTRKIRSHRALVIIFTRFANPVNTAGAKETMAVADQFDGDRRGTLTDPFGHVWLLATKKDDVSIGEMRKRFETMMNQGEA